MRMMNASIVPPSRWLKPLHRQWYLCWCIVNWLVARQSGWRCALKGGRIYLAIWWCLPSTSRPATNAIANMTQFALSRFGIPGKPTRWRVLRARHLLWVTLWAKYFIQVPYSVGLLVCYAKRIVRLRIR